MRVRLLITLAALVVLSAVDASAADLRAVNAPPSPRIKGHAVARQICVAERGPDAPPYGYGCLDHWVRIHDSREVLQDNGAGYVAGSVRLMRRYPPENYAEVRHILLQEEGKYFAYGYHFGYGHVPGSLIGCPGCR